MDMDIKESVKSVVDKFSSTGDVSRVYGEPIEKDGRTIIPVASVTYGVGGGHGRHGKSSESGDEGEGAGGYVSAKPIGVVEITAEKTRFIRFSQFSFFFTLLVASWTLRKVIKALTK